MDYLMDYLMEFSLQLLLLLQYHHRLLLNYLPPPQLLEVLVIITGAVFLEAEQSLLPRQRKLRLLLLWQRQSLSESSPVRFPTLYPLL